MALRPCPACRSDVEDVDGFCLLGHRLALSAPTAPLAELRADVDRAFAEAQTRVDQVLAAVPVGGVSQAPAPPPRPPAPTSIATKTLPVRPVVEAPEAPAQPAPQAPAQPAPEAPALPTLEAAAQPAPARPPAPAVYSALEEPLAHGDPIAAFAPAPRMDWGPERSFLRRPRRPVAEVE